MKWNETEYLYPAHMNSKCHTQRMWQALVMSERLSYENNIVSIEYITFIENRI